ncbi:signal peptidase II [Tumebacillus sp. ITR2]|uniref:Lipoprotein signal peptidase n=1 Tax=Tumebacillus amylolyticus TaxID=2801339 RepID=A0ABS1JEM8_9BACL|nr:signal peptidase II [Tumebacillus amylolyticus]MBL0388757.1 signal peptidase II [Tumebacillus amylolyticus]
MYFYLIIALVVAIDQWVKYYVRHHLEIGQSVPLIDGVINLTSHRNAGAAFSILEGQQWFFILSSLAVVAAVIYYRRKGELRGRPLMEFGVALLVAGAIGNMLDRLVLGVVTDFFDLQFVQFAIFNVADIAINLAVVLIVLAILIESFKPKTKKAVEE